MALKQIINLVEVLETYRGHDRIMRLVSYAAMFMGGDSSSPGQKKWMTVSKELAGCRIILRLFDDLSMLLHNLSTGFGLKGTLPILKPFELLGSILNQCYYPSEHIAWLRQKEILKGMALPFRLLCLLIWMASLFLEVIKALIRLRHNAIQAKKLMKQRQLDSDNQSGQSPQNMQIKENLKKLYAERQDEVLCIVQNGSDIINAISWMPPGFLWAQSLPTSANGVIGMISSLVLLYRNWPAPRAKASE